MEISEALAAVGYLNSAWMGAKGKRREDDFHSCTVVLYATEVKVATSRQSHEEGKE